MTPSETFATPSAAPRRAATAWTAALIIYWVVLFAGTHFPSSGGELGPLLNVDKLVHAGAYFVLATLLLNAARGGGDRLGRATRLSLAGVLLAYGAVDELTQPLAGRTCDFADWVANTVGVALACAVDAWRTAGRRPKSAPQ